MVLWIEDYRKKISIAGKIIKEKALGIYNRLQDFESSVSHQVTIKMAFNASHGWLTGFLKRDDFHNVKIQGELASADANAAKNYPDELEKVIQENRYTPTKRHCFERKCQLVALKQPKIGGRSCFAVRHLAIKFRGHS